MSALDSFRNPPPEFQSDVDIDPLTGTPAFNPTPLGIITDEQGNNAFYQNLWSGGFNTSQIFVYEYYLGPNNFDGMVILPGNPNNFIGNMPGGNANRNLQIATELDITFFAGTFNWKIQASNGNLVAGSNAQAISWPSGVSVSCDATNTQLRIQGGGTFIGGGLGLGINVTSAQNFAIGGQFLGPRVAGDVYLIWNPGTGVVHQSTLGPTA